MSSVPILKTSRELSRKLWRNRTLGKNRLMNMRNPTPRHLTDFEGLMETRPCEKSEGYNLISHQFLG